VPWVGDWQAVGGTLLLEQSQRLVCLGDGSRRASHAGSSVSSAVGVASTLPG
jgi:hypothetical protein